jgi:cell division transport system permease protein
MGPRARYLLSEIGIGLRRNLLMTVATIVTVTVSLALLGVGLLVQRQVEVARSVFFSQVEVAVYLDDGISETERSTLEQDLREHPVVAGVDYESKEDAFTQFQDLFADNPSLLASVTPEMLPASFRVELTDAQQYAVVESAFREYPGVNEVTDQQDVLDNLFLLFNKLRDGAWWIAGFQILGAGALIFNTIRVTAFARREQTAIMKLVGATNWYIRLPFLLEGIIAGLFGALLASGLLVLAAGPLLSSVREQILFLPVIGVGEVVAIVPILVLGGIGVAAIASLLSLRRFLAV